MKIKVKSDTSGFTYNADINGKVALIEINTPNNFTVTNSDSISDSEYEEYKKLEIVGLMNGKKASIIMDSDTELVTLSFDCEKRSINIVSEDAENFFSKNDMTSCEVIK